LQGKQRANSESSCCKLSSWADVAGGLDAISKTIDLRPESKVATAAPRLKPVGRIPSSTDIRNVEPLIDQARIVFLLELPQHLTLANISDAIKEGTLDRQDFATIVKHVRLLIARLSGPIHTIQFAVTEDTKDRFCGIIFQYARDAEAFFQVRPRIFQ
jgi:hypothetical protein